jgi:hypothetical protein
MPLLCIRQNKAQLSIQVQQPRIYPIPDFQYYSLSQSLDEQLVTNPSNGGYQQSGLISYMGRVMYEYDNKYMITATLRSDASSRLAPGYQWIIPILLYRPDGTLATNRS